MERNRISRRFGNLDIQRFTERHMLSKVSEIHPSVKILLQNQIPEFSKKNFLSNGSHTVISYDPKLKSAVLELSNGRRIGIHSNAKLFPGEKIELAARGNELAIETRTFGNGDLSKSVRSLSLSDVIENSKHSSTGELLKLLPFSFPNIEWKEDTPVEWWKGEKEEGRIFYGKKEKADVFQFEFEGKKLGKVLSVLESDSAIRLYIFVERWKSYIFLLEKRSILTNYLEKNSISLDKFSVSYKNMFFEGNFFTEFA